MLGRLVGLIRVDDDIINSMRLRVQARANIMEIAARSRVAAEREVESAANFEILAAWREAHPGRDYKQTPKWPQSAAMLTDTGEGMIRIWIGHDWDDSRNGIEPIPVKVNWTLGGKRQVVKNRAK
jgi:hypothetical protein